MKQFTLRVEDDEGDLTVAEDAQLVGLLHQAELPLRERHLTVALVADARDLDFLPTHGGRRRRGRTTRSLPANFSSW